MYDPLHVSSPSEEDHELDGFCGRSCLCNQEDGQNVEQLRAVKDAKVVPAPAAVVCNEISGCLVEKLVLLFHDAFFLSKGSDHACSSHALVEIRVYRTPNLCTDSMHLFISNHEGWNYEAQDEYHQAQGDACLPATDAEHCCKHDDDMTCHSNNVNQRFP